jgi:hypothetical protein
MAASSSRTDVMTLSLLLLLALYYVISGQAQELSDITQLPITVCHYPPGCSKLSPIEHRLFSHITIKWAGIPLRSFDTML